MITPIDSLDIVSRELIVSKVNELIDEHNSLLAAYEYHHHTTLDGPKYQQDTSGPKTKWSSGS